MANIRGKLTVYYPRQLYSRRRGVGRSFATVCLSAL